MSTATGRCASRASTGTVPIDVRANAHLMYKVVLSWEDKARCATPFDMIARDLGEFWLLDQ